MDEVDALGYFSLVSASVWMSRRQNSAEIEKMSRRFDISNFPHLGRTYTKKPKVVLGNRHVIQLTTICRFPDVDNK